MTIFKGAECRTTKMNIAFVLGNGVPNTVLSFFLKNPVPSDLNSKNWFWGHIFPHIYGSIGPIVYNSVHL